MMVEISGSLDTDRVTLTVIYPKLIHELIRYAIDLRLK